MIQIKSWLSGELVIFSGSEYVWMRVCIKTTNHQGHFYLFICFGDPAPTWGGGARNPGVWGKFSLHMEWIRKGWERKILHFPVSIIMKLEYMLSSCQLYMLSRILTVSLSSLGCSFYPYVSLWYWWGEKLMQPQIY